MAGLRPACPWRSGRPNRDRERPPIAAHLTTLKRDHRTGPTVAKELRFFGTISLSKSETMLPYAGCRKRNPRQLGSLRERNRAGKIFLFGFAVTH
jgi:hypothetical protein